MGRVIQVIMCKYKELLMTIKIKIVIFLYGGNSSTFALNQILSIHQPTHFTTLQLRPFSSIKFHLLSVGYITLPTNKLNSNKIKY